MLERTLTIYVMHRTNEGIYLVDKLMEFSIPNSKDQMYVLKEVIEKGYMFKVWFDVCHLFLCIRVPNFILI